VNPLCTDGLDYDSQDVGKILQGAARIISPGCYVMRSYEAITNRNKTLESRPGNAYGTSCMRSCPDPLCELKNLVTAAKNWTQWLQIWGGGGGRAHAV
jgi:hypothetical protein